MQNYLPITILWSIQLLLSGIFPICYAVSQATSLRLQQACSSTLRSFSWLSQTGAQACLKMRTLTRHCKLQSHWLWPFRRPLNAKWGVTNDLLENPKFCFFSAFWAFEKGVVVSTVHVNLKRQLCLEKNFQRCIWNYWPRDSRQDFMLFPPRPHLSSRTSESDI